MNMRELTTTLNVMTSVILSGVLTEAEVREQWNYNGPLPGRILVDAMDCAMWFNSLREDEDEEESEDPETP